MGQLPGRQALIKRHSVARLEPVVIALEALSAPDFARGFNDQPQFRVLLFNRESVAFDRR
jgi:hypothetical protein